jgi:hypothetical protein
MAPPDPMFARDPEAIWFARPEDLEPAPVAPSPPPKVGRPRKEVTAARWELGGADVTPCTRCKLRGHVAGDPDRCLYYHGSLGMGGQSDQAGRAG